MPLFEQPATARANRGGQFASSQIASKLTVVRLALGPVEAVGFVAMIQLALVLLRVRFANKASVAGN